MKRPGQIHPYQPIHRRKRKKTVIQSQGTRTTTPVQLSNGHAVITAVILVIDFRYISFKGIDHILRHSPEEPLIRAYPAEPCFIRHEAMGVQEIIVLVQWNRLQYPLFPEIDPLAISTDKEVILIFPQGPDTGSRRLKQGIQHMGTYIEAEQAIAGADGQNPRFQLQHGKRNITVDIRSRIPV